MKQEELHNLIAQIAPIHGISFGDWSDKSTWVVSFKDEATQEQIDSVAKYIDELQTNLLSSS